MGNVRGSRIAFAAAYVTLVAGLFIALGGVAYAQSMPSAATDQYEEEVTEVTVNDSRPTVAGVTVSEASGSQPQAVESQALPFTGLSLVGVALVGGALVAFGVALRRRERKSDA